MPRLYMITVPGLEVKSDWRPLHDRLLDEFPHVTDVLATTIAETVLIVYEGRAEVDAWLQAVNDAVRCRRIHPIPPQRPPAGRRHPSRRTSPRTSHTSFSDHHHPNTGGNPA